MNDFLRLHLTDSKNPFIFFLNVYPAQKKKDTCSYGCLDS
jgi:hypothetical protein